MRCLIGVVIVAIITLLAAVNLFYLRARLTAVHDENVILKQQLVIRKNSIANFATEKRSYHELHKIYQNYKRYFDFPTIKMPTKLRAVAKRCGLTVKKIRIVSSEKTNANNVRFNVVAVGSYVDIVKYISVLCGFFVLTRFDVSYLHRAILQVNVVLSKYGSA